MFNHGSTGRGTNPESFTRSIDFPEVARFFVAHGWAVVTPARRGRGGSEGQYDEGFAPNRSAGYACDPVLSVAGAERGLRDLQAAMDVILAMPFVDRTRVVIGGQSRGGILSVAYAGQHAEQVKGVINFVGGWNGSRCQYAATINQGLTLFAERTFPDHTLWLYGDDDTFYPLSHSRANFDPFKRQAARYLPRAAVGVRGTLHLATPGSEGPPTSKILKAACRQPMTRPPMTRMASPVM